MASKEEDILIQKVKNLYYSCQIKECIQFIDDDNQIRGSYCHQMLQLYKGLSQFKAQLIQEAFNTFQNLIMENKQLKGNKVDELDVLAVIFFQLETQYFHIPKAEQFNSNLLQVCELYREQNENLDSYQKGVYLYGKGLYIFIETSREGIDEKCIQYMQEALSFQNWFNDEIIITIAWCCFIGNKIDQSCQWFQKIYEVNPRFPSLANNYALACEQLGDLKKTEKLYLEEMEVRWFNQVVINNMSLFYGEKMNDQEKQQIYQEKLINLKPMTARICHYHGVYLNKKGRQQEAIQLFKQGIQIDPSYIANYENLSEIIGATDYQNSLRLIEKCIEMYPEDGCLYTSLGRKYEVLQDHQKAIDAYTKSIQLKNYQEYKIYSSGRLSYQYYFLQNYSQALREIFKACSFKKSSTMLDHYYTYCWRICQMKKLPLKEIIQIINEQSGQVITRFEQFANKTNDKNIRSLYLVKLDYLRTILYIISYRNHVEHLLSFKNNILYWDLFID
ncbi:tetratricopeptide repeat protein (macronuclear) [Tetrahymena thermophila SB210]|uniref:Tetratricopeptide repeat protein n=1 Tax=Tetrahymena thermophila (strain SB210) TaxID=312017 RepID=Q22KN5_TETTS|nr:tetratricopeptide repeat protein [Tetrahymena thermophila SB210]EAR85764.2 tetratricopeptide repeat protein [Tetrahymena thermophila SB210]|eukprot:XP_001033427.2 tetratricopeptide repeat protein [Tetrahymena thermophila SB210]